MTKKRCPDLAWRVQLSVFLTAVCLSWASSSAEASERLCQALFATPVTADLLRDFENMGRLAYIKDGMGTVQRVNLNRLTWVLADSSLNSPSQIQNQLTVDRAEVPSTGVMDLRVSLDQPADSITLGVGSRLKFQRSSEFVDTRIRHSLSTEHAHGFSIKVGSSDQLQMKAVVKIERRKTSDGNWENLDHPLIFESPVQAVSNDLQSPRLEFLWRDFVSKEDPRLQIEKGYQIGNLYFVVQSESRQIQNAKIEMESQLLAKQDLFGADPRIDYELMWRDFGSTQRKTLLQRAKVISQNSSENSLRPTLLQRFQRLLGIGEKQIETAHVDPVPNMVPRNSFLPHGLSREFRTQIISNLHSQANQNEAMKAYREGTLQREVESLGFSFNVLSAKFDSKDYFKFFSMIVDQKIPIESGDFGAYHGEVSHALQIYAMTRGMNAAERDLFGQFYREIGNDSLVGWKLWSILFDGVDPTSPMSPRYWNRLISNEASVN